MAASHAIKGFILAPNYAFGYIYNATSIEVLVSGDNINWVSQGTYTANEVVQGSSATAPDYRNINFYSPVSFRYVRFVMVTLPNSYGGFAEINAVM